ncbi:MAG: major capsid protein [Prevotella sp.]|nr:major capsid protein [Prevotella sp.]
MPKFDFNTSRYARLFSPKQVDRKLLMTIVNDEEIMGTNNSWYLTQGSVDPSFTPVDSTGLATFTVMERKLKNAPLADLRAPLGDAVQMDKEGLGFYSATIPDFITQKFVETAMSREDKEKRFAMFGNDTEIMKQWITEVTTLRNSMDATMTWMTAQLMTTGKINYDGIGQGIYAPVHKANIPERNFRKAGAVVWTDPSAKIISEMQAIEGDYRTLWGWSGAMKWQMTKKFFLNVFIKNAEVLDKVNEFRTLNDLVSVTFNNINTNVFNNAWENVRSAYGLSPIELVEEKELNKTADKEEIIQGWADNIVVLRPTGDAVRFMRKQIMDETYAKYLNEAVTRSFVPINNGLGTLVNTTVPNGMYKEWQTVIMFSAVPALVEFTKHVIVDTATANS